jgi:exopolysaccharide biosynthesis polyprenyl glycosylphosphotransferase
MAANAPQVSRVSSSTSPVLASERIPLLPNLALRISERRLLLAIVDLLIVNASLYLTLVIRSEGSFTGVFLWGRLHWFVVLSVLWFLIGEVINIYDLNHTTSLGPSLWNICGATSLTALVYLLIPYLTPALPKHRFQLILFPLFATAGVGLWRTVYSIMIVQSIFHQRALIVGAGASGRMLVNTIAKMGANNGSPTKAAGYRLLGFVDDHIPKGTMIDRLHVLGDCGDLVRLTRELRPDEIILAVAERETTDPRLCQAILDCRELGVPITTMDLLYERLMDRVPLDPTYGQLSALFPVTQSATNRFYMVLRRLLDIVVSIVGCLQMLVLIPVVWLGHRICSPGPLFYRQRRVGKSGRIFTLIKFRSMVTNAEMDTGPIWASVSDARITKFGRILRKTRLDEVPQFWNVLKGEMTLIGPRPERPEFVSKLTQEIPFYRARHAVKPGITGWAQVKYKYGASTDEARIKLQYDLYYIKYQGPRLDLMSLLQTLQVVLASKGR